VTYKMFDVVRVPFPFTDQEKSKLRPALVISSEKYAIETSHSILVMITTAKNNHWGNDLIIDDFQSANLPVPSKIRFKIFTLDNRLIVDKLGILDKKTSQSVNYFLQQCFNFC
jgi:mRNA-degrading endonuclease toxin of MazEF toxin-antitoxin module